MKLLIDIPEEVVNNYNCYGSKAYFDYFNVMSTKLYEVLKNAKVMANTRELVVTKSDIEKANETLNDKEFWETNDNAKKLLKELPTYSAKTDGVSQSVFDQIKWERDVAIEQLKDLGYGLGEKPRKQTDSVLEDIKAKIKEKESKLDFTKMSDVALKTAYIEVTKLIDKHISRKE